MKFITLINICIFLFIKFENKKYIYMYNDISLIKMMKDYINIDIL